MKFVYEGNQRLDAFLADYISDLSRSQLQTLIKNGKVTVEGKAITKPKTVLQEGQEIEVDITFENQPIKPWDRMDLLNVIDETDDYIIINKPSGLTVHPGNGNREKTLANILAHYTNELSQIDEERPGIVHRLDKDTSGIMVIAKNIKFHNYIQDQFEERTVDKVYVALTEGNLPHRKGMVDAPIGRDENNRLKMTVTAKGSKPAQTEFNVTKRYEGHDMVEFKLLTGRTHQIRVHAKYIQAPILGDITYGKSLGDVFGQYLHAYKIGFNNLNGEWVEYTAELPEEFKKKIGEIENGKN